MCVWEDWSVDLAKLLLASCASEEDRRSFIDRPMHDGKTALRRAVATQHEHLIRYLLENGADITLKDKYGFTPAMVLCKSGLRGRDVTILQAFLTKSPNIVNDTD